MVQKQKHVTNGCKQVGSEFLGELQLEAQPGSVQDVPLSKIGNARLRMSGGAVSQDEILRRNLGSGVWVH